MYLQEGVDARDPTQSDISNLSCRLSSDVGTPGYHTQKKTGTNLT